MRGLLYRTGVPLLALVAGAAGSFPIFVLGLFVPAPVVIPLSVAFAALFCALVAAWTANLTAPDGSRSRLTPIIGVTEAAALATALLLWLVPTVLGLQWAFAGLPLLLVVVVMALAASVASWGLRTSRPGRPLRHDVVMSLTYVGLGVGAVAGVVLVTCSIVPCIP